MSLDQSPEVIEGSGADRERGGRERRSPWPVLFVLTAVTVIALVAYHARRGAVSDRIRNPEVEGAPRPVDPLFGFDHWVTVLQIFTIFAVVAITVVLVIAWRRNPRSPLFWMAIVTTLIVWQDPIMNWSPFAVYNPDLWHWPEDWPLVSISPTVEPFLVFGYVLFYFGPYFPAVWILRKLQARKPVDSFVWRHPLLSLAGFILVIGFIFDAMLEIYFAYGTGFAIIKWTRAATSVACPWPYPEAKVYDPQGFYELNGQPGPYSVGIWSTWMSAQPDGRPDVTPPADGGRCGEAGEVNVTP